MTSCLVAWLLMVGCDGNRTLLQLHEGPDIGIDFVNSITTNDTLHAFSFEYIYNGSGVGVGDFNHDGLEDLFFGGNQVSSRLYINRGHLRFQDVTDAAQVATHQWVTGVSVVDINQDGWPDIYLAVAGKVPPAQRRNLLFINQAVEGTVPVFREEAATYGLDDDSYSTMGAFLDYDRDGDLDLYLVNNWLESYNRNNLRPKRVQGEAQSTDKLYRNNGNQTFTDVSAEAGILIEGYGLGVAITDLNRDGWPDIYVANDFMSNDLLWINQQNGTFRNEIADYLKHQSHNGMGIDIADINNDDWDDIIVVDMLPPGHERQKMMVAGQNHDHFHMSLQLGYEPQYMRNTLQLNQGAVPGGKPLFSEVAFQAGVAQTDWSWAPLFIDMDNDGWRDLFISNGYRKDVTDLDFIFFGSSSQSPFGTPEVRAAKFRQELEALPPVPLKNFLFQNNQGNGFIDQTDRWCESPATFSNGAAYADFDQDGDMDWVVNNIDQAVLLYENKSTALYPDRQWLFVVAADHGSGHERIYLYSDTLALSSEVNPYRGFQSTVSKHTHFGLGVRENIDSVVVVWPDGWRAVYRNVQPRTTLVYQRTQAAPPAVQPTAVAPPLFAALPLPPDLVHQETSPSDMKVIRTLLHDLTRNGPCIAVADVNGDGWDDLYRGAEVGMPAQIWIQNQLGGFDAATLPAAGPREDGAATFFDEDGDGDQDLVVAGACATAAAPPTPLVIYRNLGGGNWAAPHPLLSTPPAVNASCVVSADWDRDGDLDLFVGSRFEPGQYPMPGTSMLLQQDNGHWKDVTATHATALSQPGMITTATWFDYNQDGWPDLAVAGEWMPIRIFKNNSGRLEEVTQSLGIVNSSGWWNCLRTSDLDGDGFSDLIAGNAGDNSYFRSALAEPVELVAKDFDGNGTMDPLVVYYNPSDQEKYLLHNRMVLLDQIPAFKRRFDTFKKLATTPFKEMLSEQQLRGAFRAQAQQLSSQIWWNREGKRLEPAALPREAQVGPLQDVAVVDVNGDTLPDLVGVGNAHNRETFLGHHDASVGFVLVNQGNRRWKPLSMSRSGWQADRDARTLHRIRQGAGSALIIGNNNAGMQLYQLQPYPAAH